MDNDHTSDPADVSGSDEMVVALKPAQIGALVAAIISLVLIWRAIRRSD